MNAHAAGMLVHAIQRVSQEMIAELNCDMMYAS